MTLDMISRVSTSVTSVSKLPSEKSSTQEAAAISITPQSDGATEAAAPATGHGGLLLPSTATNLLKLLDGEAPREIGTTALSHREWLQRSMKLSAASDTVTSKPGDPNYYSQKDLDVIKAATGYNLVVINGGTTVVDDNSNPAPDDVGTKVSHLAASISGGRASGAFSGEVNAEFLKDNFARFSAAKEGLPDEWLKKALDFLDEK